MTHSVNVFISSTFRDMTRERDILTRIVFPQVREQLGADGIAVYDLDLRWGVTQSMAAEGGAVGVCLDNVARCSPLILGILGDRYGWQITPDLLACFDPDFAGHIAGTRSLTALELFYALHRRRPGDPDLPILVRGHALSDESRPALGCEIDEARRAAELKSELAARAGVVSHTYHDYDQFADLARAEILRLVRQATACRSVDLQAPDLHASIERSREQALISAKARKWRPLVIHAAPGAGSTWLVRQWLRGEQNGLYLDGRRSAFAGIAAGLRDHARQPMRAATHVAAADPLLGAAAAEEARAAVAGLGGWRSPTAVVLDHFEDALPTEALADLAWLPARLPWRLRLVVVTHSERLVQEARDRGFPVLELLPPSSDDIAEYGVRYLARFGKALEPADADKLARAAWLQDLNVAQIALDELRRHGQFETLGDLVKRVAGCATVAELVNLIVSGLAQALPERWQRAPLQMLLALALSVRGLTRAELEAVLLADADDLGEDAVVPSHIFGALRLGLDSLIQEGGGRLDIRDSALRPWLDDETRNGALRQVGEAFERALPRFVPERCAMEKANLIFQLHGPEALVQELHGASSLSALLAVGQEYFEGWLVRVPDAALGSFFEHWAGYARSSGLSDPDRMMLAEAALRFGRTREARAIAPAPEHPRAVPTARFRLQCALIAREPEPLVRAEASFLQGDLARLPEDVASFLLAGLAQGLLAYQRRSAARILAAAKEQVTQSGSLISLAQYHLDLGQVQIAQARWRRSHRAFVRAEACARRVGTAALLCRCLERRSAVLTELHRFSAARRTGRECLALARHVGLQRYAALAYERLIEVERRRANWSDAYALASEYIAAMREGGGDVARATDCLDGIEAALR